MRITTAAFALLPFGAAVAQDVAAPESLHHIRDLAAHEVEQGHTPSIAVGVYQAGKIVWAEGFGIADRENGTKATADTIYRLASISKPFTATAIMQFVERGLIDLDGPANRYLDLPLVAYRGTADKITVRRLLNHTAGLPTHWNFFYGDEQPPPRAESIRAFGFAAYEPGTRANYSNFGFGVLDHIVARLGKKPYRRWLVEELLDPLRMTHTDVGMRPGQEAYAAVGYQRVRDTWQAVEDYGFDHDGASAVRSSVNDLMRFARLQLDLGTVDGVRILDEKTVIAMRDPKAARLGGFGVSSGHGAAWRIETNRGEQALSHSGGMPGVSTKMIVFPEHDTAVAVLTNSSNRGPTNRVLNAVLDQLFVEEKPQIAMGGRFAGRPPNAPKGRFVGQIAHPDGPLPLALSFGFGATIRIGDGKARGCKVTWFNEERANVKATYELPLGHGPPTEAELSFEFDRTEQGLRGLLYATVDGTCKLPFWAELTRAAKKHKSALRVVSYNVLVGFQDSEVGRFLPGVQRLQAISSWLAAQTPDVVALQEMNGFDAERLQRLAAAWGHGHVVMLKESGYPVALTSTKPITVIDRHLDGLHHGMLHARTHDTDFVVVHFVPSPGVKRKLAECERALECYERALAAGKQAIVLGDFNSIAAADVGRYSPAARERYGKWRYLLADGRPAEIAMTPLLSAGAVDVLAASDSLPVEFALPRIDFVLASPELAARCSAASWRCEPDLLRWSDHPPVLADFDLRPRRK